MACIEEMEKEVLLSGASFREVREFVEGRYTEIYYVDPGFRLLDRAIIGVPPIPVAVDREGLIIPYTKPCYGTFLIRVECPEEVARVRSLRLKTKR